MNFDPVVVLNHFVAPGVAEPSTPTSLNPTLLNRTYEKKDGIRRIHMLSHYPSKPTHEDDRKRQRSLAQHKIAYI
nr:ribosomal protein S3 [Ipomoea batatas]